MINITQIPTIYQLAVYDLLGSKQMCDMWWSSSNVAFDLKTPLQQWELDKQVVKDYILQHCDYSI